MTFGRAGSRAARARPRGVTRVAMFYLLAAGAAALAAGGSLLAGSAPAGLLLGLLLAAAINLACGVGLLRLRRWAYWAGLAVQVLAGVGIPLLLIPTLPIAALTMLALGLAIVWYLLRPHVRAAFRVGF